MLHQRCSYVAPTVPGCYTSLVPFFLFIYLIASPFAYWLIDSKPKADGTLISLFLSIHLVPIGHQNVHCVGLLLLAVRQYSKKIEADNARRPAHLYTMMY